MVGINDNILSSLSLRQQVFEIQRTDRLLASTQKTFATGKKVNSALDDPQNFFASDALSAKAHNLERLLDNLGQNKQTMNAAIDGLEAISRQLEQAEAFAKEALVLAENGAGSLHQQILADNPVAYWRMDETSGTTATNLGLGGAAINGTYTNGVTLGAPPIYEGLDATTSAAFNGTNQFIAVPDSPLINLAGATVERTIEVTFNANDVTSRQVLYEEGANVNSLNMYVEGGNLYVNGRDQGAWGPLNISTPIEAGETYHATLIFDLPNGEFRGYLNGEEFGNGAIASPFPSHSGDIGIGAMRQNAWFHDGQQGGNGFYFNGRISNVAIYNTVLTDGDLQNRAAALDGNFASQLEKDYESLLTQIDQFAQDSTYRGTGLLVEDSLVSVFNEDQSSFLVTGGSDFTSEGLGLTADVDFSSADAIQLYLSEIRGALDKARDYSFSLANDISVIDMRENFINKGVHTLRTGSDKLTLADMNEESAKMLALDTRQKLQTNAISISAQSSTSIAGILFNSFL